MLEDWTKLNKTRIKMIIILNRMSTLPLPYQFPEIVKFKSSLTHQYQITACLSGSFSVNQISKGHGNKNSCQLVKLRSV